MWRHVLNILHLGNHLCPSVTLWTGCLWQRREETQWGEGACSRSQSHRVAARDSTSPTGGCSGTCTRTCRPRCLPGAAAFPFLFVPTRVSGLWKSILQQAPDLSGEHLTRRSCSWSPQSHTPLPWESQSLSEVLPMLVLSRKAGLSLMTRFNPKGADQSVQEICLQLCLGHSKLSRISVLALLSSLGHKLL